jgi:beta-glucosidase
VQGVQSAGVIATSKHYIGNDQETLRGTINAVVSQRALAEIYDPAFQATVDAGLGAVMCAYNKINGPYACENPQTLQGTLDHGLGFRGFVMSDWGATHSTVPSTQAGLDMSMPGGSLFGTDYYGAPLAAAVADGSVPVATINGMVRRILWAMFSVGLFDRTYPNPAAVAGTGVSTPADNQVALTASEQGTVLLKNDRGVLPLSPGTKTIAVIGDAAGDDAMYGGGGSASVNPTSPVTPLAGITGRAAASGAAVTYAQGNTNYRSLAAVADTGFAPTSGPGPGWTATYYAGPAASGTPLGSEVVTSLDVTSTPAIVTAAGASTWSVSYTATMTPSASGVDEFALGAGAAASLSIGGRPVISYGPGTGSVFTGLVPVTAGRAAAFELDVTGLSTATSMGGPFGPTALVDLTWAPQENLLWAAAARAARTADVAVVFRQQLLRGRQRPADPGTARRPGPADPGRGPGQPAHRGGAQYQRPGVHALAPPGRRGLRSLVSRPAVRPLHRRAAVRRREPVGPPAGDLPRPREPGRRPRRHGPDPEPAVPRQRHGRVLQRGHRRRLPLLRRAPPDAAVPVRLRPVLHHVLLWPAAAVPWRQPQRPGDRPGDDHQHGGPARRRGRTALSHRPGVRGRATVPTQGFQKVMLAPGQSKVLTFPISLQDMSYYQAAGQRWVAAPGRYLVSIGSSERDLALAGFFIAR